MDTKQFQVIEKISSVTISVESGSVPPGFAAVGQEVVIAVTIDGGSDVTLSLDFGDGDQISPTLLGGKGVLFIIALCEIN